MSKRTKKYYLKTFGCQSNMADSDRIRGIMADMNYSPAVLEKSADVVIYNTCSVRESAENRIFGRNKIIQKLKSANRRMKIVLTGCMIHHSEKTLRQRMPLVDFFLPIRELQNLPALLGEKVAARPEEYLSLPPKRDSKFRAWIPISYGCNNFCTYCIVPFARGREHSRPAKEILFEVRQAVQNDYKEIWLLGQNVNSYGTAEKTIWDSKTRKGTKPKIKKGCMTFAKLLCEVNKIPGNFWIRFTSAHPKDFSDDLIKAMAECKKFPKYINLPAQSGDNAVLKRMNRQYTREHYLRLVKKIRAQMPAAAISTDAIVGFSGETAREFKNTEKLFKEAGFEMAFIAEYSSRPGTAAAISFKDDVPHAVKEARRKTLTKILEKTSVKNNKKFLGQTLDILVDEAKGRRFFGKSPQNKTVEIFGHSVSKIQIGDFVKVKITNVGPWKLGGELV